MPPGSRAWAAEPGESNQIDLHSLLKSACGFFVQISERVPRSAGNWSGVGAILENDAFLSICRSLGSIPSAYRK
jgi:hypothetical protein